MNLYFLDSGYLIALEAKDDQYHEKAQQNWKSLFKVSATLVTSSYIFDEVVAFFNSRGHHSKAVQLGESLLQSSYVNFIHVDQELFNEGWNYSCELLGSHKMYEKKTRNRPVAINPNFSIPKLTRSFAWILYPKNFWLNCQRLLPIVNKSSTILANDQ